MEVLQAGQAESPSARPSPAALRERLDALSADRTPTEPEVAAEVPSALPVQYWDEDTVRSFRDYYYRIVSRLGSGGVGTTFKVMEVDASGERELSGPYVAKAITNATIGPAAAQSYARVRPHTGVSHLAGILEVTREWVPDQITALLRWVEGDSLASWTGALPLYLEEQGEIDHEAVLLRWAQDMCHALRPLHRAGLVHGDVSPKNIILSGAELTLTDFDLSVRVGATPLGGTSPYCSSAVDQRDPISASDDLYSLASSLFHVLFDRAPFDYPSGRDKARGIYWEGLDRPPWTRLSTFLDRATDPDSQKRFADADTALAFLSTLTSEGPPQRGEDQTPVLSDNEVPWLAQLLQSYPGSRKGNVETRGLDSSFAVQTYVETELDRILRDDIRGRRVSLVILCGNAGDGKTAFLQHLAGSLGLDPGHSSRRIWDETLPDGVTLRANLDGSAAYQGRPAQELLDEFFAPFMDGSFPPDLTHLLAINDGPLLAWLEEQEATPLTTELRALLDSSDWQGADGRIRFIDLNTRSLVGGITHGCQTISTEFLDSLLAKLLGEGEDLWAPCLACTAQGRCHAWRSVSTLRDQERGPVIRRRLARALQAVHHRGEIHVTARSLRAALGYVFFGTHYCRDLHEDPAFQPPHYWDRVFDPESEGRQGELLGELQLLDPGLDAHPMLDRRLLDKVGIDRDQAARNSVVLRSLRRQAYLEWPDPAIRAAAGDESALHLHDGSHLPLFQRVATGSQQELAEIRDWICEGIARLEDLPEQAYAGGGWPLKITPRTPTETAFWVTKPRNRFSLEARMPRAAPGLHVLHTHVKLTYRFSSGHEESLLIDAALFNLLMEIRNGYQVSDTRSDDVFANLSIFKQRLAHEEERTLYAWNPLDDRVFRVSTVLEDGGQRLVILPEASQ